MTSRSAPGDVDDDRAPRRDEGLGFVRLIRVEPFGQRERPERQSEGARERVELRRPACRVLTLADGGHDAVASATTRTPVRTRLSVSAGGRNAARGATRAVEGRWLAVKDGYRAAMPE